MFDVKKRFIHTNINIWQRFIKTILPDKKQFYSSLNMEEITDTDYKYTKRVWKNFKIKNLGECHDLYAQNKTLLLAEVLQQVC